MIADQTAQTRTAHRKRNNTEYFLQAARNLLGTDTSEAAIVLGYFAAENKAEEALALAGYQIETHVCVIKGVSRVLEEPDIARDLDRAYDKRKETNYNANLGQTSTEAPRFIEERIMTIIEDLEDIIERNHPAYHDDVV